MERYQQVFQQLAAKNEGAFVPFVQLGDPTPALSLEIIDTLIAAGADALELGIPFSDPLADGRDSQPPSHPRGRAGRYSHGHERIFLAINHHLH